MPFALEAGPPTAAEPLVGGTSTTDSVPTLICTNRPRSLREVSLNTARPLPLLAMDPKTLPDAALGVVNTNSGFRTVPFEPKPVQVLYAPPANRFGEIHQPWKDPNRRRVLLKV